jgi:hypothetical protein
MEIFMFDRQAKLLAAAVLLAATSAVSVQGADLIGRSEKEAVATATSKADSGKHLTMRTTKRRSMAGDETFRLAYWSQPPLPVCSGIPCFGLILGVAY